MVAKHDPHLDELMERLAVDMAQKLIGNSSVDKDITDTFKALTTYYAQTRKLSKVPSIEDDQGGGFGAAKRRVEQADKSPN